MLEDCLLKSSRVAKGDAKRLISAMFRPITPQENGHGSPVTPATNVAPQSNGNGLSMPPATASKLSGSLQEALNTDIFMGSASVLRTRDVQCLLARKAKDPEKPRTGRQRSDLTDQQLIKLVRWKYLHGEIKVTAHAARGVRPRTWRYAIAHCMRDKVHGINSWQSSRTCPMLMLLVPCVGWRCDAARQISRDFRRETMHMVHES